MQAKSKPELTLDPSSWEELRQLGHQMVDDMVEHLSSLRSKPAWQPMPDEVRQSFKTPAPMEGDDLHAVYETFRHTVLPYPNGNLHPRYWGWVQGTGTPVAMLADMLAAGLNPHLAGFDQAPALVEEQVIDWFKSLMGYPPTATGVLTSGGSMANLLGLSVARVAKAGWDVRREGLHGHPELVVYGSAETHSWAQKACELMGLGANSLRRIPVDDDFRLSIPALEKAIAEDRAAGRRPICVIATVGAVNTGVIDDLPALRALTRREDLWLHVDGAFGAFAALSPQHRHLVAGMSEADSLVFDLHKWMYMPFEAGCLLVRDEHAQRGAFAFSAAYLAESARGPSVGRLKFAELGYELTRGFKALKVWMSLKTHGVKTFAALIEQNIAQAEYVKELVRAHPKLELAAQTALNIVCFRFVVPTLAPEELDALNTELLLQLQESGVAVPSSTRLRGRFAIRLAITNHRSRREDFEVMIAKVVELGERLSEQWPPPVT